MKKALITVVGLAGYNKRENKVNSPVEYVFSEKNIETEKYNMLELMMDEFSKDYEVIPIYTDDAQKAQKAVFEKAGKPAYAQIFKHPLAKAIESESSANSYETILKKIDEILDNFTDEDEVILDITHGWRHLPILMIIDAIIHKLKNPSKIKKIYFAKEIVLFKKYEIIDITEYLELTLFVIMLNVFMKNYTIADNFKFSNRGYESVKAEFQLFREYILSNSVKTLIENNGVIDNIIKKLNSLTENDKKVGVFEDDIKKIKKYLFDFKNNYKNPLYLAHFYTSKMLFEKKYLLNAITFLIESQSFFAKSVLEKADSYVKKRFKRALEKEKRYEVLKTSKNFFLFADNLGDFKSGFYYESNKKIYLINKNFYETLKTKCAEIIDIYKFKDIVDKTNKIRNTLAHINMEYSQRNIENKMKEVLFEYENLLKKVKL